MRCVCVCVCVIGVDMKRYGGVGMLIWRDDVFGCVNALPIVRNVLTPIANDPRQLVDKIRPRPSQRARSEQRGQLVDEPCAIVVEKLEAKGVAGDALVHEVCVMGGSLDVVPVGQIHLVNRWNKRG